MKRNNSKNVKSKTVTSKARNWKRKTEMKNENEKWTKKKEMKNEKSGSNEKSDANV